MENNIIENDGYPYGNNLRFTSFNKKRRVPLDSTRAVKYIVTEIGFSSRDEKIFSIVANLR